MALLTLAQAKSHLGVTTDDRDADIMLKLAQAEVTILARCGATAHWAPIVAAWTDATVPLSVQAAILILLGHLDRHRGDDDDPVDVDKVWAQINQLLALHRDPVIA